jgi:hypothetical protein
LLRILLFLVAISSVATAQLPGIYVKKATGKIEIDAEMKEADWQNAEAVSHFKQFFPFDSSYAKAQTEVRLTYDDQFIYVFAIMHNRGPRKYVTPSLRRDFRGQAFDSFVVVFDTYQDKTNAFSFGINPFGVQREGLVSRGGVAPDDLSLSWDNKWYSEANVLDDRWVCEFAIPFKTIRYKEGLSQWNVNFYRNDTHETEQSTWSPISRAYNLINLVSLRQLNWDQPLKHPGPNISVIPYSAARNEHNFQEGKTAVSEPSVGGDAKVALGPALNLDLTINPDFSQVEVDQQITNLNRFENFYPEKRQFFLENADLFGNFGSGNSRPFFSRRIGVTKDNSTGQNIENRIYAGARLSGKIDNNWRVGFLTMQAAKDKTIGLPSINYSVAAIQRKIFSRSNLGLIGINKQALFPDSQSSLSNKFNRLLGLDYTLASKNNHWVGKAFYHRSFDQLSKNKAYAATAQLTYQTTKIEIDLLAQDIGANFNPEVGYTPRKDFRRVAPEFYYSWYPKSKIINNHGPGMDVDVIGNNTFGTTDWDANIWYKITFQNTANFFTRLRRDYGFVFSPFDPTFPADTAKAVKLPFGSDYYWNSIILNYQSNGRKRFFFNFQSRLGQYYNGERENIDGSISYRIQPHAVISIDFSFNRIRLPKPYNSANLVLISPKFDFTFTRKLFWTTYIQYNNQINNVNINSRLQYRFKPVSDFFLVYTDNYFAETFTNDHLFYLGQPRLRAVVLKLTYWLNL